MNDLLRKAIQVIVNEMANDIESVLYNKHIEFVAQYTNQDVVDGVETVYEEVFVYDVEGDMTLEVRVAKDTLVVRITEDFDGMKELYRNVL